MTPLTRSIRCLTILPVAAAALVAQGAPARLAPGEGQVAVAGGRIWYRVVGTGPGTPVILAHGCCGPGHWYLKPLAALADERPVIFYDQLGNGLSEHPADTLIWAPERRVAELEALRRALGLTRFHLYGHSGGARIALEYVVAYPAGVRSLILAGPVLSDTTLDREMAANLAALPDSTRRVIVEGMQSGRCDTPAWNAAWRKNLERIHARRLPWSADLDSSVSAFEQARAEYRRLGGSFCLGPGAFYRTELTPLLARVRVPTLFVGAEYDWSSPASVRRWASHVPGSEVVIIPASGHLTSHDQPERDVAALRRFLSRAERP